MKLEMNVPWNTVPHKEKYTMLYVIFTLLYNKYGWRWSSKLEFKEQ